MIKDESFGIVPLLSQNEAHLFLLVQHQAGHWSFPKGHAEPGESPLQAACREFEEETGIIHYQLLDAPSFTETYSFVKKQQPIEKTVTYFLATVPSAEVQVQESEVQAYAWLPFPEALTWITFPQSQQLLQQVEQYLQANLASENGEGE
jgi:8-oxo-dGTP pyrophosphatase MutT (NUDIX family)